MIYPFESGDTLGFQEHIQQLFTTKLSSVQETLNEIMSCEMTAMQHSYEER